MITWERESLITMLAVTTNVQLRPASNAGFQKAPSTEWATIPIFYLASSASQSPVYQHPPPQPSAALRPATSPP